jgi:DNA-3-methyladenine glycosylase I
MQAERSRCAWPGDDALLIRYHDEEWGRPLHDDRKLFEFLVLDAFQAGLSWKTILHKRENFRKAFASFDPQKVARFDEGKVAALLEDAGIIRNRVKINATLKNAQCFLATQREFGTFDTYIWQFTKGKTITNRRRIGDPPAVTSAESDAMSRDMIRRGFKFVGSTICYAFMQAAGMVNDHATTCFCYKRGT